MGFIAGNIIQLNGCFGKPCWIFGKYRPQLPQFSLVSRFRKMKSEMCVDVFLFLVFLSGAQSALLATFGMLQVLESSRAICQYAQYIPVEYGANANCLSSFQSTDCWINVAEVGFAQKYDCKIANASSFFVWSNGT